MGRGTLLEPDHRLDQLHLWTVPPPPLYCGFGRKKRGGTCLKHISHLHATKTAIQDVSTSLPLTDEYKFTVRSERVSLLLTDFKFEFDYRVLWVCRNRSGFVSAGSARSFDPTRSENRAGDISWLIWYVNNCYRTRNVFSSYMLDNFVNFSFTPIFRAPYRWQKWSEEGTMRERKRRGWWQK